ncbi:hypothetical protein ACPV5U_19220 [Vibrio mediterranei]
MKKFTKAIELPAHDSGPSNCIVRVHNLHVTHFKRRQLVVISQTETGRRTLRYVMGGGSKIIGLTKTTLAIDYDAFVDLGVSRKDSGLSLEMRKANWFDAFRWFWNCPDVLVRLNWRFLLVAMAFTLISFADLVIDKF